MLANTEAIIDFSDEDLPKNILNKIKEQNKNIIKKIEKELKFKNFKTNKRWFCCFCCWKAKYRKVFFY